MDTNSNRTVPDLIEALGGNVAVARILGSKPSKVSEMKRAGRINARYWKRIVDAARETTPPLDWVTSEALMLMHSPQPQTEAAQ